MNKVKYFLITIFFLGALSAASKETNNFLKESLLDRKPSSQIKRAKIKRSQIKTPQFKSFKKKKRVRLRDIQPPPSTRLYYAHGSDEAELEEIINEEIQQIFKLLKKSKNAELVLRLGGLYADKARLISKKIQLDYEKKIEDYKEGRRRTKPSLNLKPSQIYNKKSLKLFQNFKENYPKHERIAEVLFFLGFNSYQLNNKEKGIKYFLELETRFPKSSYLYEAQFHLGEHYFQSRNWKKSFYYYNKISKNKRGKFYFFALYKMAWSSYKMNQVSRGLAYLQRIIKEGQNKKLSGDTFTFNKEAIGDLVLFYTQSRKSATKAKFFFSNLFDEKTAWSLLKKLAQSYRDYNKGTKALIIFEELIRQNPVGSSAFKYKYQIFRIVYNVGKTSQVIKQLDSWIKNYGPNSLWAEANSKSQSLISKSFALQESIVRRYSLESYENFKKSKTQKSKLLALHLFKRYFAYYSQSSFLDQMQFFYGELLFDSKKYLSAVKSYEELITRFRKSKYTKVAFINQILALERVLPKDKEIRQIVGKQEEPIEFTNSIKAFIKVASRYITHFPSEKNAPSIMYKMATLYYTFNQFSMAAQYFKKLSNNYPQSKLVSNVGGILLDIYNKNKDYESLEKLANQLVQSRGIDKSVLYEANLVLEQISFKKAQDLAHKKEYKKSAVLYEKFAREHPRSILAASSFYNAGLNFEKNGDRLEAISMYSAVLAYKGKGNQKIRKNSQEFLAILYEKLAFYKAATKAYTSFAKNYSSDPKSARFWFNAGIIFDALNDIGSAVYSYQKYYALSKKRDRKEVFYLMGQMYQRNQRWQKAISYYDQYIRLSPTNRLYIVKASSFIADIYEKKLKNTARAYAWRKKTMSLYKKWNVGISYGARSHFHIIQKLYRQFSRVQIPANTLKQKQAVTKKIALLKNLEKSLKPIIRYNDGEQIIASLTLIGQANQEMAQAIYKAPAPKGLNKASLDQYKQGIKKVIEPYIQNAVKNYQLALKKSSELQVYSEWIQQAYKGLSLIQIKGDRFESFLLESIDQEVLPIQIVDLERSLISSSGREKYGLSSDDFEKLSEAMAANREDLILKAVSVILNKDPENTATLNSLALFYLQNNKLALGELILNRISSKKSPTPEIMNNLAIIYLKYGFVRKAIRYFKKAIQAKEFYSIAKVNLATLFVKQYDYQNAHFYYKSSYERVINKLSLKNYEEVALLNNYAVALTGIKRWDDALSIFKNLSRRTSPLASVLFNYAINLTEKSREEDPEIAERNLLKAKELEEELALYVSSVKLKKKLNRLSQLIRIKKRKRNN